MINYVRGIRPYPGGMEHVKFLTFIQRVFELLPKLMKQSRLEPIVTNDTKFVCGSYLLTFVEHLIANTTIHLPKPCCVTI
ncbi:hypothetical protein H5410_035007 [Solanum commersonii]|uniref:Uncharacterized protein n=1 Tax=Solanum commersonii TaxID=4109 RepID=A0A9J5Y1P7_SOLCO|nr:hypothetical protein H5410_035007 [Solanum commersonii]